MAKSRLGLLAETGVFLGLAMCGLTSRAVFADDYGSKSCKWNGEGCTNKGCTGRSPSGGKYCCNTAGDPPNLTCDCYDVSEETTCMYE